MIKWFEKENMKRVDRISILGAPNFAHVFSQTLIPKKYVRAEMATVGTLGHI